MLKFASDRLFRLVLGTFLVRFQVRHNTLRAKQVAAGDLVQRARTALVVRLELAGAVVQDNTPGLADTGERSYCRYDGLRSGAFDAAALAKDDQVGGGRSSADGGGRDATGLHW